MGTYCLVDMEMWLDLLGISSISKKEEIEECGTVSKIQLTAALLRCILMLSRQLYAWREKSTPLSSRVDFEQTLIFLLFQLFV